MAPKKLSEKHLFAASTILDIRIAPGGHHAAVVVQHTNTEKQRNETTLHVWRADGDRFEPLTNGPFDSMPRWLGPDELIFASREREKEADAKEPLQPTRLYRLSMQGGEPRLIAELPGILFGMEPSPNGRRLALVFSPHPSVKKAQREAWKHAPRPYEGHHRWYKMDGFGVLPKTLAGVHTVALREDGAGKPKSVLESDTHAASSVHWTPDGRRLVVLQTDPNSDESGARAVIVPASGGAARGLAVPFGPVTTVAVDPKGERLVFGGNGDPKRGGYLSKPLGEISTDPDDEKVRWIAQTDGAYGASLTLSDIAPSFTAGMVWREESTVVALHSLHGRTELVAVNTETAEVDVLAGQTGVVWSFDSRDGVTLYAHGDPTQPGELYRLGRSAPVSRLNRKIARSFRIQPRRWYTDSEPGVRVDSYLWATEKQISARKAASLPLVLYVHGGPIAQVGDAPFHEYAWLAEEGFPVLASNPRGSVGYGDEFGSGIYGNWGDRDAHDLLAVVDAALGRYPQFDPKRVYVVGGSYGGYMTLWMLTRHPKRFAGGVAQRCVSNYLSMAGTSDLHNLLMEATTGLKNIYEDPARAWEMSPISRIADVRAPLLLLHSDNDLRCPVGQSEEVFHGLVTLGRKIDKDVRLVIFRGESHGLSRSGKPENRRVRLQEILGWLRRCDKKAS